MGKYIRGSCIFYIDIMSGVCDHWLCRYKHDNQVGSHLVLAPGMVSLLAGGGDGHLGPDDELSLSHSH